VNWQAVFEFFADNPPSIAIAGGILLFLVSALTAPDRSTTDALRSAGLLLFVIGFILQILWLFRDAISERM
jgi:hypothetical protein